MSDILRWCSECFLSGTLWYGYLPEKIMHNMGWNSQLSIKWQVFYSSEFYETTPQLAKPKRKDVKDFKDFKGYIPSLNNTSTIKINHAKIHWNNLAEGC